MACDCNKTYSIGMGCCVPTLAPADNFYTKYQTEKKIEEAVSGLTGITGCCITPEEVDEKISAATDDMATQEWVENKGYITGVDLSNYATKAEIPIVPTSNTAFTNDAGYLTEHQPIKTINGQSLIGTGDIEIGTGGTIDLSNYYTTAQTVNLVESAVTRVEGEIPTVPTSNTAFTNDAGYLTEHQSLSGYATEQWVLDKHYITGVDLSDYATKAEIPVVPTSNTAFTNDAGYLTEHQSLTAYSTTSEVNTLIDQSVSGKQDTLSAGTGIDITNDVISCTVTGGGASYSASSGINIANNEISTKIGGGLRYAQDGTLEVNSTNVIATGNTQVPLSYVVYNYVNNNCMMKNKIWCGTITEYNSITNKDSGTLYLIHE